MGLEPDFKLMLEILGAVAASIVAALSNTVDTLSIHELAQAVLVSGILVWVAECIRPMPKDVRSKRSHPLPKQVTFAVMYLIVTLGLLFFIDISILFVAVSIVAVSAVGDSVLVCCEPNLVVWVTICYVLLRVNILSIGLLRLLVAEMVSNFRSYRHRTSSNQTREP